MGEGVRIAIVDDGLEVNHPDIQATPHTIAHYTKSIVIILGTVGSFVQENLRLDSSYNFNANIPSPNPRFKSGPSGVRNSIKRLLVTYNVRIGMERRVEALRLLVTMVTRAVLASPRMQSWCAHVRFHIISKKYVGWHCDSPE